MRDNDFKDTKIVVKRRDFNHNAMTEFIAFGVFVARMTFIHPAIHPYIFFCYNIDLFSMFIQLLSHTSIQYKKDFISFLLVCFYTANQYKV